MYYHSNLERLFFHSKMHILGVVTEQNAAYHQINKRNHSHNQALGFYNS